MAEPRLLAQFLLASWLVVSNVAAFGACALDKRRAQRGLGRVRERTLLLLALVGGSPGLLLGMLAVRHKTRKPSFQLRFAGIVLLQAVLVWFLLDQTA